MDGKATLRTSWADAVPDLELGDAASRPDLDLPPGQDLWVFAYGSLMWDPGFPYLERHPALLRGYHRSFCVYSHRYRGTPQRPGLVLGLDRGGSCRGIVYRVAAARVPEVLAYLWQREMTNRVYRPRLLPVAYPGGRARACAFVVDRRHTQYCGALSLEAAARIISCGVGVRGRNVDYLANTVAHLDELGIPDTPLHRLLAEVRRQMGEAAAPAPVARHDPLPQGD